MERQPKTDEEWLAETAGSPHLTKIKCRILGQIALEKLHMGFAFNPVDNPDENNTIKH